MSFRQIPVVYRTADHTSHTSSAARRADLPYEVPEFTSLLASHSEHRTPRAVYLLSSSGHCGVGRTRPTDEVTSYGVLKVHRGRQIATSFDTRPRCFEHGCEGRTFSCAENLRRHLREKSATKSVSCPFCSTNFTRRSNRDKHVARGACKILRELEELTRDGFGVLGDVLKTKEESYSSEEPRFNAQMAFTLDSWEYDSIEVEQY